MLLTFSGIILLLLFLLVTYLISSFEKICTWKKTYSDFCDLFKDALSPFVVLISTIVILGIEITTSTIIGIALFNIVTEESLLYA
ncbi:MAG: hypothetical protein ABJD23_15315, partial [Nonlabens sp.]